MKKGLKEALKVVCFLLLSGILFLGLQKVFVIDNNRAFQNETGFYLEKPDTLDAVYVGASNVYCFWLPPMAWKDHGIAVWSYSLDSMPAQAFRFMITEARKTQPDALYIINLNSFKTPQVTVENLHRLVDFLPLSRNKVEMINALCEEAGFSFLERIEYYLPIIRFHSRWSEFTSWDFSRELNEFKSATVNDRFRWNVEDVSEEYIVSENRVKLTAVQDKALGELLDYCDAEGVNTLFVTVPQVIKSKRIRGQLNTMEDLVRERGYPCLDLLGETDSLGIQTDTDFFDTRHTNVHGSLKYTEYLCHYLKENYDLDDKRGKEGWESWDDAVEAYTGYIAPYCLPLEREHADRDYELSAPLLNELEVNGDSTLLSWEGLEEADGYEIYRKVSRTDFEDPGPWTLVSSTGPFRLQFEDKSPLPEAGYTYTVIAFRRENGKTLYGEYDFKGVSYSRDGGELSE